MIGKRSSARKPGTCTLAQTGDFQEAEAEIRKALDLSHGGMGNPELGHLYAATGRREAALSGLARRRVGWRLPP
jgi:Flp pilus assembly protein TadD